jgi:hypothetical protein
MSIFLSFFKGKISRLRYSFNGEFGVTTVLCFSFYFPFFVVEELFSTIASHGLDVNRQEVIISLEV